MASTLLGYADRPVEPPTRNLGRRHTTRMVIGIDAHKRPHTAVGVDQTGRQLSTKTIGTKSKDHLSLLRWATEQSGDRLWAIETAVT